MAHFAQLDDNNQVIQVLVIGNDDILDSSGQESEPAGISFCQALFGANTRWVQTSYNGTIRKNYAGIGYTYDSMRDAFIPPQDYPFLVLDEETCRWALPADFTEEMLSKPLEWHIEQYNLRQSN
jgi:hypothetical protein